MTTDNHGFSLIELVVSLAVLSIVSTAIMGLAVIASRHYQTQTKEVKLQYEAQLSMNQLQDILIDAQKGVSYSVNGSADRILKDEDITASTVYSKQLTIYNTDRYYIIKWNAAQEKLLYSEYYLESGLWKEAAKDALMADYVHTFSADLSEAEESGSIRLEVEFNNQRKYGVTQNVTLRNRVAVNKTQSEIYGI